MLRTTFKGLLARKRRLLGTSSAVLIGVAFLAATLIVGDTARGGFADLFADANAGTDAVVRNATSIDGEDGELRGLLDAATVDAVAAVDGVEAAVPTITGFAQILDAEGDPMGGNGPPTLAGSWIEEPSMNPYELSSGEAPDDPDEVVIDKASADDAGFVVGDRITVRTPAPVEMTVAGIARFQSEDGMGAVTYVGFTPDTARELLLGGSPQISSVLVAAEPGVSQDTLVERLSGVLPDGAEAITGAELTQEQRDMIQSDFLGFFEAFLLVFAGVALLVATFSIYNTFSILVAQRARESALLRAIGASRRQVLGSIALEAIVVGAVASVAGLAAGVGLAAGLMALMSAVGLDLPYGSLTVDAGTIITSLIVGVAVTLVASAAPAVRASRVPPIAALRDAAVDRTHASILRAVLGSVVTAAGVALALVASTAANGLGLVGLGALTAVIGMVLLGPVVARSASALLGAPLAVLRGRTGGLARRNAMRNPRRTAGTASALMVGVAVVALFTTLAASLKASIDESVEASFGGDLVIESEGFSGSGLSTELAPAVSALPEVAGAVGIADANMVLDGSERSATVAEPSDLAGVMDLDVVEGSLADLPADAVAVSSSYAEDHKAEIGSVLPAGFADGAEVDLTVGAIYEREDLLGSVILTPATWAPHDRQSSDVAVLVQLADGVSLTEGKAAVQTVSDRFAGPDVMDKDEFVAATSSEVDGMLAVVYGMLFLAILIALMGIANTLSLSIHERTRELGLLRAVGQTRSQLRSMVRWESVIVAVFGTLGGLGLGTFLGWTLIRAIETAEGFGTFTAPAGQLALVLAVGAIAGVLAAVRPARRAAKLDVLAAITTE